MTLRGLLCSVELKTRTDVGVQQGSLPSLHVQGLRDGTYLEWDASDFRWESVCWPCLDTPFDCFFVYLPVNSGSEMYDTHASKSFVCFNMLSTLSMSLFSPDYPSPANMAEWSRFHVSPQRPPLLFCRYRADAPQPGVTSLSRVVCS
jgi:hypothetical protein